MDEKTIDLVQDSWAQVLPIRHTVGRLFYDHLFAADPTVQCLFRGHIEDQASLLMNAITLAVDQLGALDALAPRLQALGLRHAGYGVVDAHYDRVGDALMRTLALGLGDAFTEDVRAAWARAYHVIASEMKAGAALSTEAR